MEMVGISLRAMLTEGSPALSWDMCFPNRLLSLRLAFSLLPNAAVSSPSPAGLSLHSLCWDGARGLRAAGGMLGVCCFALLWSWRKQPHAMLGLAG